MALNERSGLFTVEVLGGLAIVGYLLYVTEKTRSYIADTHPVDITESLYYSSKIDDPEPTYHSSQSYIDDYNTAANWVLTHTQYFSSQQITKATDWVRKVQADPNYLIAGYDVDLIQRVKSGIRAPRPVVPSQSVEVLRRYAEASYVTDHPQWFTQEDLDIAISLKLYISSEGAEGGTSQSQSGPPVPDDYVAPPPPTPASQTEAVQQATEAARKPPASSWEAYIQQATAAAYAAQQAQQAQQEQSAPAPTYTEQQAQNIADAQAQQAARADAGRGGRNNY